jgi:FixJ family two-component response regulator
MPNSPAIVAVVDDDAGVRESLKLLLEVSGFLVEIFPSATDFLRRFRDNHGRFRCLVVDHNMPDLTGLDLIGRLRADGHSISALLATGALTPEIARRAAEIGIEKVLAKPIPDDELLAFAGAAERCWFKRSAAVPAPREHGMTSDTPAAV